MIEAFLTSITTTSSGSVFDFQLIFAVLISWLQCGRTMQENCTLEQ